MKRKIFAALLCAASAHAQAIEAMPELVVTATRTEQAADATLASVTVITREDIEHRQAQSLPELLRGVAGLTFSNSGGAGKTTSVFLRGTNSDHVLVLVDGIKIGSATTGTASFQDIPVDQIERIEIVRGPRASLYGSEAIGGVIQIFTRRSKGPAAPSFSATAGSYGTLNGTIGLGGSGQGWYDLRLDHQSTEGFNACNGKPAPGAAGCRVNEPDKDGYRNLSLGLNGGYRFENSTSFDVHALQTDSFSKSDGSSFAGNETRAGQQVVAGTLKFAPLHSWNVTLRGGHSRDDSDLYYNGVRIDRYNTARETMTWQNDVALDGAQTLSAGLDYQQDRIESLRAYARTSRNNHAVFGQYLGDFGAHSLQASVRHDNNQQFGGHNTGGIGYGYAMSDTARLMLSWGTAFKAPTFNQLYYPGFGSPTLRPERSRSIEAGIDGHGDSAKWSLHAYQTEVSDLIGFDPTFTPVNIDTSRLRGVEAQLQKSVAEWSFAGTLTWQDPRQTSGVNQGKLLNRRATKAMRLEVSRNVGDYRVSTSLYAEGRRYDDLANTQRLGGYALLDLRAEYRIAAAWLLQGRVDNLADRHYETAQYYNQPGRGVYLTLNYRPER